MPCTPLSVGIGGGSGKVACPDSAGIGGGCKVACPDSAGIGGDRKIAGAGNCGATNCGIGGAGRAR